jgi:glutathione S-transferase
LNENLTADYICGKKVTIADIAIAATLDDLFRIVISEPVRKALANVVSWYEKVKGVKEVKKYFGGV